MSDHSYRIITERIIKLLDRGTVPWRRPWSDNGPPRNLLSRRRYRGINAFMLSLGGFASPFWLSARQIQKIGGAPKPGENPTQVICWRWVAKVQDNTRQKGSEEGEREVWTPWCWFHEVFNTDQCTGIEHAVPGIRRRKFNPVQNCERIIERMPKRPKFETTEAAAYYSPPFDSVNMPNADLFESSEEYYATLFHELVHSTGHSTRLDRHKIIKSGFDSYAHSYSYEELVAEVGCAFLCAHTGIVNDTVDNSSAYIQGWLSKLSNDEKVFFFAAAYAQKAVDFILGRKIKSASHAS